MLKTPYGNPFHILLVKCELQNKPTQLQTQIYDVQTRVYQLHADKGGEVSEERYEER